MEIILVGQEEIAMKGEEERKAKEEIAMKAEVERKAKEEAAKKAEEMHLHTQSLEVRVASLLDTSNFVDEVFAKMGEEPIPMTQEEIVHMPNIIQEEIAHMPTIITQEEIVHMPAIIIQHGVGLILPVPNRCRYLLEQHGRVLPCNQQGCF